MDFRHRIIIAACAAGLAGVLVGCEPPAQNAADDEKEPHYVLGQKRLSAMDYPGAAEAFAAALEANPHSAMAHYQLAMICENEKTNPAVAIYHYEQYLRFDPKASNAEIIAGRIYNCKVELAKGLFALPSSPAVLQQLQQLTDKNRQLQDEVNQWRAHFAAQTESGNTNLPARSGDPALQPATAMMSSTRTTVTPGPTVVRPRTHSVVARDTPAAIARKYSVSLDALMAANPGLNPRKLHVGQIVNLPPP
jgi:tetratricopeptide (TPR) repeat protein